MIVSNTNSRSQSLLIGVRFSLDSSGILTQTMRSVARQIQAYSGNSYPYYDFNHFRIGGSCIR